MPFERSIALSRKMDAGLASLSDLCDQGYSVSLHLRGAFPLARFSTLSSRWVEHYRESGFPLRDPLLGWASANEGVARWSDPSIPDPYDIMAEARRFGLLYGGVARQGPVTSMTVALVARRDREMRDDELLRLQEVVRSLHDLVSPPGKLTFAQIEALSVIAAGKRYAGAAAQLGISESALKARLYTARERLMARTTPEAVRRAKDFGLL